MSRSEWFRRKSATRGWEVIAAALIAAAITTAPRGYAAEEGADSARRAAVIAEIKAAWEKRSQRLRACRIDWDASFEHNRLGCMMSTNEGLVKIDKMTSEEINELMDRDPLVCEQRFSFLISGVKCRYERTGGMPAGVDTVDEISWVSAADGQQSRSLHNAVGGRKYPSGWILKGAGSDAVMESTTLPVRASLCPLDAMMSGIPALESLTLDSSRDGGTVVLFERYPNGRSAYYEFDGERQYQLTRRTTTEADGKLTFSLDVSYSSHPAEAVWVPLGWNIVSLNANGKLDFRLEARVTHVEINPALTDDAFKLEFPPGTLVTDYREGAAGFDDRFGDAFYLVKPDGSPRIIGRSERTTPYDELLKTPSSESSELKELAELKEPASQSGNRYWILIAVNVVVGLLLIRRVFRRR